MIQLILTILGKARVNFAAERGIAIAETGHVGWVEKKTRGNKQRLSELRGRIQWKRSVQRQSKTDT